MIRAIIICLVCTIGLVFYVDTRVKRQAKNAPTAQRLYNPTHPWNADWEALPPGIHITYDPHLGNIQRAE